MVAGMTPSTVKAGFVSPVFSAGFRIELAGGGHYNPAALRSKVAEIQANIPASVGITLNALYINPREMRREGLRVEGFCVAAGIPMTKKAAEIIEGLTKAGIKHVSVKPGSVLWTVSVRSSTLPPPTPTSLSLSSGRADVQAVTTHAKTYTNPSSLPILPSATTLTSCSSAAPVLVVRKTFGHT